MKTKRFRTKRPVRPYRTAAIINDCHDDNARMRQELRVMGLLGCPASFAKATNTIEASFLIVDALDAAGRSECVIFDNIAPRDHEAKKWPNGTPFGYARYRRHLILGSVDGYTFSLPKKLGLIDEVKVLDIPSALEVMLKDTWLTRKDAERIARSQFRSFDFLPYAAAYLIEGGVLPYASHRDIPEIPASVAWVDNFKNVKTTILPEDLGSFEKGEKRIIKNGELTCFPRLSDVPDEEAALVVGSSGIGENRFLEIMVQGGKAADEFDLKSGAPIHFV